MVTFRELLTQDLLKLQTEEGRIIKQRELAKLLGVGETALNLAWNEKRSPSRALLVKCAEYFRDARFYEVGDLEIPDPLLEYINRNWQNTPDETKKRIAENVGEYTSEPVPQKGTDTPKP